MSNMAPRAPRGLKWRSSTSFILATIAIGMFTDLFLYGLVVPVMPFILRDRLDIPHAQIQFYSSLLLTCYAGAQVLLSLPIGIISDRLPARQLPYLLGLVALLASTILLSLGQSVKVLILARLLQGTSAGVMWTLGLAMVMETVGYKKLGVTIGSIFSFISVGELVAPVLGGVVYKKAGSDAVFGMAYALLILDFAMRLLVVEKKIALTYGAFHEDSSSGVTSHEQSDEESALLENENGHGQTLAHQEEDLTPWKVDIDSLPAWVQQAPIIYCFANSRMFTAQVVCFMHAMLLAVFDATIPTEVHDLFGFDSLQSGLIFIPLIMPYIVLGPIMGRIVDRYGARRAASLGMAYTAIPLVLLCIPHAGGISEIVKFSVLIALCSIGLAAVSATSVVEASFVMERYHVANPGLFGEHGPYAKLYAINSMVFSAGLTVGPMISGTLREKIGYGKMNVVIAGFCVAVSILSFTYLGKNPKSKK